jgi:hypothetical protein
MPDFEKLIAHLRSDRQGVRYDACEELRVAATIPEAALLALQAAVNDSNPSVAEAARRAVAVHTSRPRDISVGSPADAWKVHGLREGFRELLWVEPLTCKCSSIVTSHAPGLGSSDEPILISKHTSDRPNALKAVQITDSEPSDGHLIATHRRFVLVLQEAAMLVEFPYSDLQRWSRTDVSAATRTAAYTFLGASGPVFQLHLSLDMPGKPGTVIGVAEAVLALGGGGATSTGLYDSATAWSLVKRLDEFAHLVYGRALMPAGPLDILVAAPAGPDLLASGPPPRTSSLAIAALVLSVLPICVFWNQQISEGILAPLLLWTLSLVLGIVSLVRIKRQPAKLRGSILAVAAIVMSLLFSGSCTAVFVLWNL